VWLGHFVPTPHSTHIFAVAGTLRVPLSQPQKRHIQPERSAQFGPNLVDKIINKLYKVKRGNGYDT
jgi:hypothetical protein